MTHRNDPAAHCTAHLAYNVGLPRFIPPSSMPTFATAPRSVHAHPCAGGVARAGRAALRSRGVAPELAFKVKGAPAVLSMAVRDRHRD